MDKQNQIEKMAKAACGKYNNGGCEIDGWVCTCKCKYYKMAETFYNKILPENAVVLTKEDYNRLFTKARQSEIKTIDLESIVNARKETAEKFAELAKAKLNEWLKDNEDNDGKIDFGIAEIELIGVKSLEGEVISESLIDEICKEITGGEKEISNETV